MAGKKLYVEYFSEESAPIEDETFDNVKGLTISVPGWVAVQDNNDDVTYIKEDTIKRMRLENDFLQGL